MQLLSKRKHITEEWKRVRKEKLLKIKRRIELILDKEHSITAKEKGWRDAFFRPLSKFCRAVGIRANHVTYLGIVFVVISIGLFLEEKDLMALGFAVVAALSDMIDGPIARFKYTEYGEDDVTALGTFLDHFRDYLLAASFGYFTFFYHYTFDSLEIVLAAFILIIYIGIFIGTTIKLRRYKLPEHSPEGRFHGYLLPDMQTSFWGRAQFFLLIVGIIIMFVGRFNGYPAFIEFSYIILGIHIGINLQNLVQEYILEP